MHTCPDEGQQNSDLCVRAILHALSIANIEKTEIDLIIVTTCTPDYPVPSTSSIVQDKLGLAECSVMDIRSACCGSIQGIITACQFLRTGYYRTAVVVGSDVGTVFGNLNCNSPTWSPADQVNACMIGDAAAAAVLRGYDPKIDGDDIPGMEIIHSGMGCMGTNKEPGLHLPGGGSNHPLTQEVLTQGLQFFKHNFRAILEHGGDLFYRAYMDALENAHLKVEDFSLIIPHQANSRVKELAMQIFGLRSDQVYFNFDRWGNTANASLLLCLSEVVEQDNLPDGSIVALVSAESTKWLWGNVVFKWRSLRKQKNQTQNQNLTAKL
jgi:3-oxoacyl-[acyl-carrier-protein] synthase-3